MKVKNLALIVLSCIPIEIFAESSIIDRAVQVQSKLEALNTLGMNCEANLQAHGMEGAQSESCDKYLRNMQGEYFARVGSECGALLNWYESKRAMMIANPDYADKNPSEASQLVYEIRAVKNSCDLDNLAGYAFLTKPLNTIKALSELK